MRKLFLICIIPAIVSSCIWVESDGSDDGENRAPVAFIDTVAANSIVGIDPITVSAEGSFDPDNDRIAYSWRFSDPEGVDFIVPEIDGTHTFTPTTIGTYTVSLTVSDPEGLRDRREQTFDVYNRDPSPSVKTCSPEAQRWFYDSESLLIEGAGLRSVCIDFSESYDVDGHAVTIVWEMHTAPEGGEELLLSGDGVMRFVIEADGYYEGVAVLSDPFGGRQEVIISLHRLAE